MSDHIPTLADVCSAIAEGRLSAAFDGSTYQVSALELRRFFSVNYSLPAISSLNVLSSVCSETADWSSYKLYRSGL